ncbi:MAG TPA: TIGR00730 family Rossman fold protein [Verrucomicrobiae bacterium]|nr:TIGR00730 family Rossman fold protein [Verrucomicrobiae bacterium]
MKTNNFKFNKRYFAHAKKTAQQVEAEISAGLALLNKIDEPIVTILGSHRAKPGSKYYEHARKLGEELGRRGYAVATGGGPGIMQAANIGASEVGAKSVGIKAGSLKNERVANKIFTSQISHQFLFVRRFILAIKSNALVFYPGAFGTLNEFFEYVVLMQINLMDEVPVVCVDRKYWHGLFKWLKTVPTKNDFYINERRDLSLIKFADSIDETIKIIQGKK